MAEARRHGTWAKVHESIDGHAKTSAAAAVLVAELGLPSDYASAVVVRAVRRLVCWALREQELGRTGDLTDFALVQQAWPAALVPGGALWGRPDVSVLRRALRAVPEGHERGFLYLYGRRQGAPGVEFLHEFAFHSWAALKDRATYRGCSVEDFAESPYGRRPAPAAPPAAVAGSGAARQAPAPLGLDGGVPAAGGPLAAAGAPVPSAPSVAAATPNVAAPPVGTGRFAEALARLRRGSAEVQPEVGAKLERKPLPSPAPRTPDAGDSPAVSIHPVPETERKRSPAPPGEAGPSGEGWRGVPSGVARGDADAVAGWIRSIGPMSHAGLFTGAAYVSRFTEHAGIVPPGELTDGACSPGRALELLDPAAWSALVGDLCGHLPRKDFPRKYTARALAQRWEQILSAAADAAQARRARWRSEGRA